MGKPKEPSAKSPSGQEGGAEISVMLSPDEIDRRIKDLGREIGEHYAKGDLVVVTVLKGAFVFAADLVRAIPLPLTLDFLAVSSYGDAVVSSGEVQLLHDLSSPIAGKDVLVVEDIVDTGLTLSYLLENLRARHPRSIKIAALLDKPSNRKKEVKVDYVGFTIPNQFVIGFGLDHAGRHRNLPYIGVLEKA